MKVRASYKLIGRHPFKIGFDDTDYYTKTVEVPDDYDWSLLEYFATQDTKEGYEFIMMQKMENKKPQLNPIVKEAIELLDTEEKRRDVRISELLTELTILREARNNAKYAKLKFLERKYFKHITHSDRIFFVDFVSKDTCRPMGLEIFCDELLRSSIMDDPADWEEISKDTYLKEFERCYSLIKKKVGL